MTNIKRRIAPVLAVMLLLGCLAWIPARGYALADGAPSVLRDLQQDDTFQADDYPANESDYRLQVIQIAESTDSELFVYVYVPSGKLEATSINISTAINDSLKYENYPLTFIDATATLYKYRVDNFTVKADALRYYDISAIYRKWDQKIDAKTENDNTVDEVAHSVAKLYTASTVNGAVSYGCIETEVITIVNPFVDYLRYNDGLKWDFIFNASDSTDVHYIAFDTDRSIDTLMEADISYVTQAYTWKSIGDEYTYGSKSATQYVTVTGEAEGGNAADGWFAKKYTWKRIQSSADFIGSVNLTQASKAAVQKTKWVLMFLETSVKSSQSTTMAGHQTIETGTKVSEVTILRLKFETDGKVYNLGTVSNKQTGDNKPGNEPEKSFPEKVWEFLERAWNWIVKAWNWCKAHWKWLVGILIGVIVLSFVIKFIRWLLD